MTRAGIALLLLVAGAAGCASPETRRIRGGGPGADLGNRHVPVVMHHGAQPYHNTPCVTKPVPCDGPLPVFSKRWTP